MIAQRRAHGGQREGVTYRGNASRFSTFQRLDSGTASVNMHAIRSGAVLGGGLTCAMRAVQLSLSWAYRRGLPGAPPRTRALVGHVCIHSHVSTLWIDDGCVLCRGVMQNKTKVEGWDG